MEIWHDDSNFLTAFRRFIVDEKTEYLTQYINKKETMMMIQYQLDLNEPSDSYKVGLIHIAAYYNSLDSFIFLEKKLGLDYTMIKSVDNKNCLHYACKGGSFEVVVYILNNYMNFKDFIVKTDANYINFALESNSVEIARLLLKKEFTFTPNDEFINRLILNKQIDSLKFIIQTNQEKRNARSSLKLEKQLLYIIAINNIDMMKLLFDNDENSSFQDFYKSCLQLACLNNCEYAVEQICKKVENIDIPFEEEAKGAIHWACSSCNPKIVKIMCEKNIHINRFDKNGNLGPVEMIDKAATADFIDIMQILIDNGFDIDQRKDDKHNSLLGSIVNSIEKDYEVITWLIKKGANIDYRIVDIKDSPSIRDYISRESTGYKTFSAKFKLIYELLIQGYDIKKKN